MYYTRLSNAVLRLGSKSKKTIVLFVDTLNCMLSTWVAFSLRFDNLFEINHDFFVASILSIFIALPIFITYGLYRAIFRYTGSHAVYTLIKAIAVYGIIYATLITFLGIFGIPRSIGVLQPLILFTLIGGTRLYIKYIFTRIYTSNTKNSKITNAIIYGAGKAGQKLALSLETEPGVKVFGFFDDDTRFWDRTINGYNVYPPGDISTLLKSKHGITDIFIAMPTASKLRQREILNKLSDYPVHVRVFPGFSNVINGVVSINDIREVEIEDLLGREPVKADLSLMTKIIVDKAVLVTGAGGSIGSELCRQIVSIGPKILILLDHSEYALYKIEQELQSFRSVSETKIIPILMSVVDQVKFEIVCTNFKIQTIFHAAAYKHVPMIESNPSSGVWNNVFGTYSVVEIACKINVETFVLISTDKAVRPTNIMGCSKRLAELILQAMHDYINATGNSTTKLTMVRFGNVLGSSGSVVPRFKEQIKDGGPVTVTHPDIIRYFMTIPEAAQLVIQAGALGKGGDVMVLDMGSPVKIIDLAKRLIHLSGLTVNDDTNPDGDVEICFSGLRAGEKLFEELLIGDNTFKTIHPRILRAEENTLPWFRLKAILDELKIAVSCNDSELIRELLMRAVPEFTPSVNNSDVLNMTID